MREQPAIFGHMYFLQTVNTQKEQVVIDFPDLMNLRMRKSALKVVVWFLHIDEPVLCPPIHISKLSLCCVSSSQMQAWSAQQVLCCSTGPYILDLAIFANLALPNLQTKWWIFGLDLVGPILTSLAFDFADHMGFFHGFVCLSCWKY